MSKDTRTQQQQQVDEANTNRPDGKEIHDGRQGHGHRPSR